MIRSSLLWTVAATFVSLALAQSIVVAQPTRFHEVEFIVEHRDIEPSPRDYSLLARQLGHSDASGPIQSGRLVAPDGTVFLPTSNPIRVTSLALIAQTFIGTWTAFETLDGVESSYQFNVPATALDGVPLGFPLITSPAANAIVGETLDVHYQFADGVPSHLTFEWLTDQDLEILDFTSVPGVQNAVRIKMDVQAPGPLEFSDLSISQSKTLPLPSFVSSTPDLAGDNFRFEARFDAVSRARTFYVVPEPGAIALAMTLSLLLALAHDRIRTT
jgi:hypothetical protein